MTRVPGFLILITSVMAARGSAPPPSVQPPLVFDSGGYNATAGAVADMNGDGKSDVVVANATGGVGVLLGNGNGTFQPSTTYGAGSGAVAVADVNGDGKPDVVATIWGSASAQVLVGGGDGSLLPAASYATGLSYAITLALADVNNDGNLDLLVGDCGANGCAPSETGALGVLFGNGDGTFRPVRLYTGGQPHSIALGDVNGDGRPDVVAANWGRGTVGVLIGNGDGSFQSMRTYGAGGDVPTQAAVADFNGDGALDIAVVNYTDTFSLGSPVGVLLGNGDGTFQPVATYDIGGWERTSLAIADVDADGSADLLVTSGCLTGDFACEEGRISVLRGNGDGTFAAPVRYLSGGRFPQSLAVNDLNGDGRLDLVATNYGSGGDRGRIGVLLNSFVDHDGPAITVSASPTMLGPPNNRMVAITVSGTISDSGSGLRPGSIRYRVVDEYGQVQPAGAITVRADGSYSVRFFLEASRAGSDHDGRQYTVYVTATDNAGNTTSRQVVVTVGHDARK